MPIIMRNVQKYVGFKMDSEFKTHKSHIIKTIGQSNQWIEWMSEYIFYNNTNQYKLIEWMNRNLNEYNM